MSECVFCKIVSGAVDCSTIYDDDELLALMDVYPWRPGHVLVIPKRHCQRVAELPAGLGERLFGLSLRIAAAIRASDIRSDDLHFLLNDGPAANQSVPHVHMHILPRRRGDLWVLGLQLLKRPIVGLLGPESRPSLDDQAEMIRQQLAT